MESRFEVVGGVADKVFMYGEASGDVGHVEMGDLAANTGICQGVMAMKGRSMCVIPDRAQLLGFVLKFGDDHGR